MSQYNDAATAGAAKRARNPAPEVEPGEDTRDPHRCHAYGCPLAGSISDSTVGGGPWFCRHHFGAAPALWAEITTSLRREVAERTGALLDEAPSVPREVQRMREEITQTRAQRALAGPSREPGEDDDIEDCAPARVSEPADSGVF